jgi:hypothetical protein
MVETIAKYKQVVRRLSQDLGREPLPEEIAIEMNLDVDKVYTIEKIDQSTVSFGKYCPIWVEVEKLFRVSGEFHAVPCTLKLRLHFWVCQQATIIRLGNELNMSIYDSWHTCLFAGKL